MADSPGVKDTIQSITDDVKLLVAQEVQLAKSELIPSAKKAGVGVGLFGTAGVFGINAFTLLCVTAALGLYALGLAPWLSFLIVAVALLLVAGILALVGLKSVKAIKSPDKTISQANETVVEIKGALQRATAAAKAPQIEGRVEETKALR